MGKLMVGEVVVVVDGGVVLLSRRSIDGGCYFGACGPGSSRFSAARFSATFFSASYLSAFFLAKWRAERSLADSFFSSSVVLPFLVRLGGGGGGGDSGGGRAA